MKSYCHPLAGCNPTPLASYLKALGILRIVAEQFDPGCRGWWQNEQFHLMTIKSKEELERLFLEQYEPTPVFNPCAAVVERRLIEAERHSKRNLPLIAYPRCGARLCDLAQFIAGTVDDQKIYSLSRGLMALKWQALRPEHFPDSMVSRMARSGGSTNRSMPFPDEAWLMLRLVHLPRSLRDGKSIPVEPSVVRLLQSNSAYRAIEIAARRLRSAGIRPPLYNGDADENTASRWAAALAFPLTPSSIQQAAELVDPSLKGNVNAQS